MSATAIRDEGALEMIMNAVIICDDSMIAAKAIAASGEEMIRFLRVLAAPKLGASHTPQDAGFQYAPGNRKADMHLTNVPSQGGVKLALRLLDPQRLQLRSQDLGLSTASLRLVRRKSKLNHAKD
jgi:type II secretory ATPase GspE/PulE/Tfp pilus assembly ATPase PilB-like protein